MTQEEEDKLNEMLQMAYMGQTIPTPTIGYGLFPVGDQSASSPVTFPTVPLPTVTP